MKRKTKTVDMRDSAVLYSYRGSSVDYCYCWDVLTGLMAERKNDYLAEKILLILLPLLHRILSALTSWGTQSALHSAGTCIST